jgi:hypothetical protein
VAILEALWYAEDRTVAFTTLYETVGTENSAKFNYHLGELTGHFVRKTADGYTLRTAGERVVQAAVEGSLNAHPNVGPIRTDDECPHCGGSLVATYRDENLAVGCRSCDRTLGDYSFPPGGLIERDDSEILSAFDRRVRHRQRLARDGVCPECSGRTRTRILRDGDGDGDGRLDSDPVVEYTCEQCRNSLRSTVGLALLDRSSVVAFYREDGTDLGTVSYWQIDWCVSDEYTTVRSTDPWRIEVSVTRGDESLNVVLDGDLSVVETRHEGRSGRRPD